MQDSIDYREFFEFSGLISGFLSGTLSQEQCDKLDSLLSGSPEKRALFERICAERTMRDKIHIYRQEEVSTAFQDFLRRRRQLAFRRKLQWCAAACAVLVIGLSAAWLQWGVKRIEPFAVVSLPQERIPEINGSRPVLTLASGDQIEIPEGGVMPEGPGTGGLTVADTFPYPVSDYNTVSVPSGCDFHFTLGDGTGVWINAASSLRYPVRFAPDSRIVYVSGEIYLEVAKESRPFTVVADDVRIEVLGTCFNVRAYPNERETTVTLAEGKVSALVEGEKYTLTPGKQLSVDDDSGNVRIRNVDVDDVLAWKRGFYVFRKSGLAKIASTLRSWYGVEIVLESEKAVRADYTGVVNKREGIDVFLSRLEEVSDVKCVRDGNVVYIK